MRYVVCRLQDEAWLWSITEELLCACVIKACTGTHTVRRASCRLFQVLKKKTTIILIHVVDKEQLRMGPSHCFLCLSLSLMSPIVSASDKPTISSQYCQQKQPSCLTATLCPGTCMAREWAASGSWSSPSLTFFFLSSLTPLFPPSPCVPPTPGRHRGW